jgi:hypothetical protein
LLLLIPLLLLLLLLLQKLHLTRKRPNQSSTFSIHAFFCLVLFIDVVRRRELSQPKSPITNVEPMVPDRVLCHIPGGLHCLFFWSGVCAAACVSDGI